MAIRNAIIAVDFDGTVVTHAYPEIGEDAGAVPVLRELTGNGCRLILYTMRHGALLTEAVEWFRRHGIPLYAVNENPAQRRWTSSPKIHADLYIDDSNLGCPLPSPRAKSGPWPTGRASANSSCARVFSTEWRTDAPIRRSGRDGIADGRRPEGEIRACEFTPHSLHLCPKNNNRNHQK